MVATTKPIIEPATEPRTTFTGINHLHIIKINNLVWVCKNNRKGKIKMKGFGYYLPQLTNQASSARSQLVPIGRISSKVAIV